MHDDLQGLGPRRHAMGISARGAGAIIAVLVVLGLVGLPVLESFARRQNELDAASTSKRIARELSEHNASALAQPPPIGELVRPILRELVDTEILQEGQQIRRHGYVFEVQRLPSIPPDIPRISSSSPMRREVQAAASGSSKTSGEFPQASSLEAQLLILARPWSPGHSGSRAWCATEDGRVLRGPPSPRAESRNWSWDGWELVDP